MTDAVNDVIQAIEAGPEGPQIGAFFDLDGTLVEGYTASAFYAERARQREIGPGEFLRTLFVVLDGVLGGDPGKAASVSFAALRGQNEDKLIELGARLFVQKIAGTLRWEARELVRAHRRKGHTLVIASSATRFQIAPVAADLGIPNILCTELGVEDGILTGEFVGPMLWGEPKARAARKFAKDNGIDLRASYAYANGDEDVPFLSSVGHPTALNPHRGLAVVAGQQGWPILRLREPHKPRLTAAARSAAAIAGFNVGMTAGAVVGLVKRDQRAGKNTGIQLASDAVLRIAGVSLDVVGEHNLWRARPAVFVANHQSSLDAVILGKLVRNNVTAVGKREARYDPRILIGASLIDITFIDRSNSEQARSDVNALVGRIKQGTSVIILPEGTRTESQTLHRFKKGAFHLAMQAGVPVVPIAIRNAGELMWRRSSIINPGTVQVAVLDPIPTDDWTVENLNKHVEHVHDLIASVLENWPEGST